MIAISTSITALCVLIRVVENAFPDEFSPLYRFELNKSRHKAEKQLLFDEHIIELAMLLS